MPPKPKKFLKRKKKKSPLARKRSRSFAPALIEPPVDVLSNPSILSWALPVLGFVLVLVGIGFYSKARLILGLGLLSAGALCIAGVFLGFTRNPNPELGPAPGFIPDETRSLKTKKRSIPPSVVDPIPVSPYFKFTLWGMVSFAFVVLGLLCGVMGQLNLANEGVKVSTGLGWFFCGVVLLIIGLWPWKRDGLAREGLSSTVEWTFFGLILALAAFLRIYKLDVLPSGVFIDMGFQGLTGLQVIYEHRFPFNLNVGPGYAASPVTIYLGAIWFLFVPNTQFGLNLMYALVCLASFPLIYWTFRQLSGPRVALLTIFILAVMRWNINFARNSFPPTMLPFFMFGCLGFLLYGFRNGKLWAFLVSATFCALGLYAYQSHQVFPLAVLLFMIYEAVMNWREVKPNFTKIVAFWALFTVLSWPIYGPMFMGHVTDRQAELSIFSRCKQEGSYARLINNTKYTALMFNRRGDPNPRHNLQDHRQLDDYTGMLFFMGFFFALSRFWRRKYFWGVTGALVMALPCLITLDAAHSSRMHGMTPFVAFLAAGTLAALWGRLRAWAGGGGDWIMVILVAAPLYLMAQQNYKVYFEEQFHSFNCWGEYSTAETMIGKEAAKWGKEGYDCFISPRYWTHFTVDYFTYKVRKHIFRMDLPDVLSVRPTQAGGGLWFGLEQGRFGVLDSLKALYPGGEATITQDPHQAPYVSYFRVPPDQVAKNLGLKARYSNQPGKEAQAMDFPTGLPPGPYHGTFEGCWRVDRSGRYGFPESKLGRLRWIVAGTPIVPGQVLEIPKGYYKVRLEWDAPANATAIPLVVERDGALLALDAGQFTSLPANHGLLGRYYDQNVIQGNPALVQWDGVLNFVNGNDFPVVTQSLAGRWTGTLRCPEAGDYRFFAQGTSGGVEVRVDGKSLLDRGGVSKSSYLSKGEHSFELTFTRPMGWSAALTLSWIRPGTTTMNPISMQYFGETHL